MAARKAAPAKTVAQTTVTLRHLAAALAEDHKMPRKQAEAVLGDLVTLTTKHASWINQIEIWFSILVRKLLRRGNFTSKDHLKQRIEAFLAYFNATMAKPFSWTMKGKPLAA